MSHTDKLIDSEAYTVPSMPCIRMIEAFPVNTDDGNAYGIRDPQNIAQHPLVLPPAAFVLASLMDGTRTLSQIQTDFERTHKQSVPLNMLEDIVRQLDEELYLDSEHFEHEYIAIQRAFLDCPIRKAAHAGGAYEGDPNKLKVVLDGLMEEINTDFRKETEQRKQVSLLVSPHIDLHRGGAGFAHAYAQIQTSDPADLYIILGTGHHSHDQYMTLTKKDFETPLGITKTDMDFVETFSERVELDVFKEEFIHRDEHSIEFQVLFLQHVLGAQWQGKIVPILCGSFHELVRDGRSPSVDEELHNALNVLREMIDEYDGTVTVIAGVDMSHVGKRFGHEEGAPISVLERIKKEDHEVLDALISGNAELFYRSIEKMKDKNNVCGLTPIYMSLACVQPSGGDVLFYDQAVEGEYDSVVSFASAVFFEK